MSDITGIEFTLTRVDDGEQGQDGKSAYESAVDGGYTGTESEFNDALAQASDAVQYFWTDNDGVHVTQVPQDDYVQDPTSAGINILINSTNGMQVLDGLTVLAFYSTSELIGDPDGAHVEITSEGVSITSPDGNAFTVQQGSGSQQIEATQVINESTVASSFSFTASGLADAINGTTITMSCSAYVSGTTNNPTFTKGTASTVTLTYGRISYNGTTGFTFSVATPTRRFSCYNVKYFANKIVPQITMQGNVTFGDTVISDGTQYVETRKSLWTNLTPTASFSAQTILDTGTGNADLAECDEVEIYYRAQNSESRVLYQRIKMASVGYLQVAGWNANRTGGRTVTVSTAGITFAGCTYNAGASNNGFAVPVEVIGIKHA